MKFVKKHPYLIGFLLLNLLCILLHVRFFPWMLLLYLAYAAVIYIINLPAALGWTGYLLDGAGKNSSLLKKIARGLMNAAEKRQTTCGPALIDLGLTHLREFEPQRAGELLDRALALEKLNPIFRKHAELNRCIAYWKCGQLDKAIESMEEQLSRYEIFSEAFYTTLGFFYTEAGKYDKALEFTDKALKENENSAGAYDNLGQLAYRQGDLEEARRQFKRALEYKDALADSKFHLGLICEAEEDYELAAEYFSLAYQCPITGLNTVTPEEVRAKYVEYFGEEAALQHKPGSAAADKKSSRAPKKITLPRDEDLNDIEREER